MPVPKNNSHADKLAEMARAYVFRPTVKQKEWLDFFKTRSAGLTLLQSARAHGVDRKTFWRWRLQPGFGQWVYEQVISDKGIDFSELHTLGMERMRRGGPQGAFYFKTMYPVVGKSVGAYSDTAQLVDQTGNPIKLMTEEQMQQLLEHLASIGKK